MADETEQENMPDYHEAPNDRDPAGGVDMPSDTGHNPPPMPGTSETLRPVQGVYQPDVGPGGRDIDTADRSLAGRERNTRGPQVEE